MARATAWAHVAAAVGATLVAAATPLGKPVQPREPQRAGRDFWVMPPGAIAWVGCDSPAFGSTFRGPAPGGAVRRGVEQLFGALVADPETVTLIGGVAGEAVHQGCAWRVCLRDYAATGEGDLRRVSQLRAVIEVTSPADPSRFVVFLPPAPEGKTTLDLGSGLLATVYDRAEPWQQVTWLQSDGRLMIGMGDGALPNWLWIEERVSDWRPYETAGHDAGVPTVPRVLGAWLNLNRLREAMPQRFARTPTGTAIEAAGLANARGVLIEARMAPRAPDSPPLLVGALAWSARSEPPGAIHAKLLTETAWPAAAGHAGDADWVMAVAPDWHAWSQRAAEAWIAAGGDIDRAAREARRTRWLKDRAAALDRLVAAAPYWVLVHAREGRLDLRTRLTGSAQQLDADLGAVFNSISRDVSFDRRTRAWSLRLGPVSLRWLRAGVGEDQVMMGQVQVVPPTP